jgi:hypothetical protein
MEYRGSPINENDVFYWEVVLMIKNHEEFTAEIDDEDTATKLYNYIISTYYETGVTELDEQDREISNYMMYFEETENEFRDYFVRIDITKKVEIPSGDIVEAMLNMRIRVLKIKIKSYWRIKEK